MEGERDSFIFYRSFFEGIDKLPEENQVELYRALCNYAFTGEIIELSPLADAMFSLIKPQIDANNKRYVDGKKGGRPRKSTSNEKEEKEKTSGFESEKPVVLKKTKNKKPNENENVNVNVNVNENVNDNDNANDNDNDNENVNENKKIHFAEFVSMTNAEYDKLVSTYGKEFADQCIEVLDNYKGANGKKYKNDYRAILNWVIDRVKASKPKEKSGNPFFDMLREEGKM